MHRVTRHHDFCAGHRVVGHESKCRHLHGHNYRAHFTCESDGLDAVGRVIDFSVIKDRLCEWLEVNWDHRLLIWEQDPMLPTLKAIDPSVVTLPFNPTAENLAEHLVLVIGPLQLAGSGVRLCKVILEETRKCEASYDLHG